jgi:hypothetical protein
MSVRKLPTGRWEARARVDGRHLKKMFGRKADAVAWEARTLADRDRGIHVDMSNRTTVAEAFAQWAAMRVVRPATAANHRKFLRNHLEPLPLGSRPLVRVKPSEIQAWVADRVQVLDPGTVRNHATLLRAMFADAVLDGARPADQRAARAARIGRRFPAPRGACH